MDPFVPVSGQYECFLTCFIIIMNLNTVNNYMIIIVRNIDRVRVACCLIHSLSSQLMSHPSSQRHPVTAQKLLYYKRILEYKRIELCY